MKVDLDTLDYPAAVRLLREYNRDFKNIRFYKNKGGINYEYILEEIEMINHYFGKPRFIFTFKFEDYDYGEVVIIDSSVIHNKKELKYYCDSYRHLVCVPYSIENLHKMAKSLGIKRAWFHKNHYDIPKKRINEITNHIWVTKISSKEIFKIIKDGKQEYHTDN